MSGFEEFAKGLDILEEQFDHRIATMAGLDMAYAAMRTRLLAAYKAGNIDNLEEIVKLSPLFELMDADLKDIILSALGGLTKEDFANANDFKEFLKALVYKGALATSVKLTWRSNTDANKKAVTDLTLGLAKSFEIGFDYERTVEKVMSDELEAECTMKVGVDVASL